MVKKIALATVLTLSSLSAYDLSDKDYSLVGFEAGYGRLSSDITNTNTSPVGYNTVDTKLYHIGMKIGAQSENYRVLLNGRYSQDKDRDFDYIMNYDLEVDYMFNFSNYANFFLGVNGGISYMKFQIAGEPFSRTLSDAYYGGNIGFNFHVSKTVDFEVGSRIALQDATNSKDGVTYQFNDTISGYCSVIFKYKMDKF